MVWSFKTLLINVSVWLVSIFWAALLAARLVHLFLIEKQLTLCFAGAIFTISSSFQMVASDISTIVFNKIYKPETVISGHKINAGIAFWVMASTWATSIPLLL